MSLSSLLFAVLLLSAHLDSTVLSSSENGANQDVYTARFPNGQNYTYHTGKGHAWAYWNGTTAEDILEGHNMARRELNLSALVSVKQLTLLSSSKMVAEFVYFANIIEVARR